MADNTRYKELNAEVRRISELVEKNYVDLHTQIKQLEVNNVQRFERLEQTITSTDASLAKIFAAIEKRPIGSPATSSVTLGSPNSPPVPPKPPFQVRSIKLDFPRFDGKNVIG